VVRCACAEEQLAGTLSRVPIVTNHQSGVIKHAGSLGHTRTWLLLQAEDVTHLTQQLQLLHVTKDFQQLVKASSSSSGGTAAGAAAAVGGGGGGSVGAAGSSNGAGAANKEAASLENLMKVR
jgi:hypothetical protein